MADIGHIKLEHFDHIARHLEINELDLKTETINRRRHYVTPDGNRYQTSAKLIYRSGESGLEKRKPIRLQPKLQEEEPAYIVSVSPISETKTDS